MAIAYLDRVEAETELRDPKDLCDHWNKKLCNSFKKPTGAAGEPGDRILRCIRIEREIQQANDAGVMGASSAEDTDRGDDDDDSVNGQVQDGDVDFFENADDDYEDYEENGDDVLVPLAGMAVTTAATTNHDPAASTTNPAAAVANPPANLQPSITRSAFVLPGAVSPIPLAHPTTNTTATTRPVRNDQSRSSTPNPGVNSNSGGNKTKNSTNRDRASVAKTIDKLATSINNSLNGGEDTSAMTVMAVSMMQQQQTNQQQQFQQQQQLNALLKQGESTLKYMKRMAKGSKKRKAKKRSSKKKKKKQKKNNTIDGNGNDMDMDEKSSSSNSSSSSSSDSSDSN